MPRLYREVPLMSIWEGSGNVNALDVLRALSREPESAEAFVAEVGTARGGDPRFDAAFDALRRDMTDLSDAEFRARRLVERLAVVFQASLLIRYAPPPVADAYCATRLAGEGGQTFGTLPSGLDLAPILERSTPKLG